MGYAFTTDGINQVLQELAQTYDLYAPKRFVGKGAFADTDVIRYEQIKSVEQIEFDEKSHYSFKEVLLPLSQTLFYFTENEVRQPEDKAKGALIFLRSCDLHSVQRLDEIYLRNGFPDSYYQLVRDKVKFVLIGCQHSFENCFCVDMKTNKCDFYDFALDKAADGYLLDNKWLELEPLLKSRCSEEKNFQPAFVTETEVSVKIPTELSIAVEKSKVWDEYDQRCINCGRCNYVCPTCTCFTMQDIFYTDNGKVGERRRVAASCMVDGFTDVAGGMAYRRKNGQRMRFRVLHKVYDFNKRFDYHMCVGCGRCDDICPEYISFSNCINKLEDAMNEVNRHE